MTLRSAATSLAIPLLLAACSTVPRHGPATLGPAPAAMCVVGADGGGAGSPRAAATPVLDAAPNEPGATHRADSALITTVAITTALNAAHAPWPRNAGERLLFAQLYEPLVRLDCTGTVVPALAESWSRDGMPTPGVSRWRFSLRHDVRFGSGEPVRVADVLASWRRAAAALTHESSGPLLHAIVSDAHALDDSTLVVMLPDSLGDLRTLASPALAIARPGAAGAPWPDGTMWYYVAAAGARDGRRSMASATTGAEVELRSRNASSSLVFQVEPDADGRDVLDAGTDVLITGSAAAVLYARTQENRTSIPLPWTRSYVLVLPGRYYDEVNAACGAPGSRPLRDALALAVHADARSAEGPCWWDDVSREGARSSSGTNEAAGSHSALGAHPDIQERTRRILYPLGDPTARELAERVVALAAPRRDEPAAAALHETAPAIAAADGWQAAGTDSADFALRLTSAAEGAYILALPHDPEWPAAARAALLARAPWLTPLAGTRAMVPLIDTRESLLIRRSPGIPRLTIMHDGSVIFADPANAGPGRAP